MKILVCNMFISLTLDMIQKHLKKLGHTVVYRSYYTPEDEEDERLQAMIKKDVNNIHPDILFTINFWPQVAKVANAIGIKYVSFAYDSPQKFRKMDLPCNYVFLFDRYETETYRKQGIDRVYHAPLATDIELWDSIAPRNESYDISLIGSLYASTYPGLRDMMDEYHKGYFKGVISAQQKIYGYYLVDEVIADKMEGVNKCFKNANPQNVHVSLAQMSYSIGSYINYLDRLTLLRLLQKVGKVYLFTDKLSPEDKALLTGVEKRGEVDYSNEMPAIFKSSKINLNPVSRVIRSGVPQRVLDVLGCRGFLLSSYQPEIAEYFVNGEELVMYDSYEDALEKADFYIKNDSLRDAIAKRGYEKIKEFFTYEKRLTEILDIVDKN